MTVKIVIDYQELSQNIQFEHVINTQDLEFTQ